MFLGNLYFYDKKIYNKKELQLQEKIRENAKFLTNQCVIFS